ncbi:hypothetical protein DZB84_22990 [Bacillus sp. HNG]|uniref:hypothetical protein n=1 Tax=Bacillus sp. HNG TaxID=2293325 RepID=UPI000E2E9FDE|nr:hypothetical protein [Bacillus sp. HNG]RFB10236.1 hypothetical protein DZB84_22990 [Bacillus sp. HNG]
MSYNPVLAFFLSFIPGVGHFYVNRKIRGFLYGAGTVGSILIGIFGTFMVGYEEPFFVGLIFAFFVGVINVLDMIIFLLRNNKQNQHQQVIQTEEGQVVSVRTDDSDRFYTIILSFIPGLGHFQLGLINRGLTFLIGFFGLGTMVVFISVFTDQGAFMVFLGILPVIWVYNMFDAVQLVSKKQRGEELVDKTILEDFEETRREQGRKSKTLATVLAIFPGAGHLYLGLQKRGIQLMAAFLFAIYILDVLRLSLFLFLIPIIWFYSFFDALQKVSKHGEEEIEDVPVVSYIVNHQKWVGFGLIALGLYYLLVNVVLPTVGPMVAKVFHFDIQYFYYTYFQGTIICILLIGGGLKLMVGSKKRKENA